jgi:hypothetical protein
LDANHDPDAVSERHRLLKLLADGQSTDGGWGPYVTAPPEVYDTAIALLALTALRDAARSTRPTSLRVHPGGPLVNLEEMIARGRRYLIARQFDDGSWLETTRPTGAESYAQRLSTTAWATMALLVSERVGE